MTDEFMMKAYRLVLDHGVSRIGPHTFNVEGDTGKHIVSLRGSQVSCDCDYWGRKGTGVCTHIVAALLYLFLFDKPIQDILDYVQVRDGWSAWDMAEVLDEISADTKKLARRLGE